MANTEGLTDEAMECLLGGTMAGAAGIRRAGWQDRLDMPMGERPAAKVIRKSRRPPPSVSSQPPVATAAAPPSSSSSSTIVNDTTASVIGNVMERPRTKRRPRNAAKKHLQTPVSSKFALSKHPSKGFPSLDPPVGQLLRPEKKMMPKPPATQPQQQQQQQQQAQQAQPTQQPPSSEADRKLAAMSADEIQDSIAELQNSLSTETLQFLKQRGLRKKQQQATKNPVPTVTNNSLPTKDKQAEKERVAQLLSAVRTADDLDALVEQEGDDAIPQSILKDKTEVQVATELLRSSVPRQSLWAVRYWRDQLVDSQLSSMGPYPELLPVSLRCLLDANTSTTVGTQIQGLALQALYHLTRQSVPRDYIVWQRPNAAYWYQQYLQDDAVPTALDAVEHTNPLQPLTAENATVAYATSSSSTSASQDGQLFRRDPLWALLSKMRMIPWLAAFLNKTCDWKDQDSFQAAVGILVLLVQRSAGAATAVVQHDTVLSSIAAHSAEASIFLQCVAARQSRATAEAVADRDETVQHLASLSDPGAPQEDHHRPAVILWRTLLRYGLGLEHVSSVLRLAAKPLALGSELAAELYTAFGALLNCWRVAPEAADVVMLSSVRRQALQRLEVKESLPTMTLHTAIFRFLAGWIRTNTALAQQQQHDQRGDFKAEELAANDEAICLRAIRKCLQDPMVLKALRVALLDWTCSELGPSIDSSREASVCAFAEAVLELISSLEMDVSGGDSNNPLASEMLQVHRLVLDLVKSLNHEFDKNILKDPTLHGGGDKATERSRICWVNRAHTALLKYLSTCPLPDIQMFKGTTAAAMLAVIGRLDVGEESTAAILFSCDALLQPDLEAASAVSSWFVRSLCQTVEDREQLDHSFKLRGGYGISQDRGGPFEIVSLQSRVTQSTSSLLPLGPYWLWKSLAGASTADAGVQGTIEIVRATLELALEIDLASSGQGMLQASEEFRGGMLYYVSNLALQSEQVLADDDLSRLANVWMDRRTNLPTTARVVQGFVAECVAHNAKKAPRTNSDNEGKEDDDKEESSKVLSQVFNTVEASDGISSEALEVLSSFAMDLCDAFAEFGGQFPFCRKVMHGLLAASVPAEIRSRVLDRLRGALHLLEGDDLTQALLRCLSGGIPSVDGSKRDQSTILDQAAAILSSSLTRSDWQFATVWGVAILARDFLACRWGGLGLTACQRRICSLTDPYFGRVVATIQAMAHTDGSINDLVAASIDSLERTEAVESKGTVWDGLVLSTAPP